MQFNVIPRTRYMTCMSYISTEVHFMKEGHEVDRRCFAFAASTFWNELPLPPFDLPLPPFDLPLSPFDLPLPPFDLPLPPFDLPPPSVSPHLFPHFIPSSKVISSPSWTSSHRSI